MPSFRKLAAFSAFIGAFAIGSSYAQAATSVWDHNGSTVRLDENGKKRSFVYDDPRGALASAGVKRGTVLFDGEEKADGRLAGYAKLFRKGCDPVDYFVEGSYDKQKGEILLQGQAPIYASNGCKITGYSDDGNASSLSFTRIGGSDNYAANTDQDPTDPRSGRPGYLPPSTLPPSSGQSSHDDQGYADRGYEDRYGSRNTYGSSRDPRYNSRADPPQDNAAQGGSQRNGAQRDYSQRDDVQRDDPGPDEYDRQYGSDSDYGNRTYYPRDYAYRRYEYYRYRRVYPDTDEDSYSDHDYDDPAYVPYQPRWRRY